MLLVAIVMGGFLGQRLLQRRPVTLLFSPITPFNCVRQHFFAVTVACVFVLCVPADVTTIRLDLFRHECKIGLCAHTIKDKKETLASCGDPFIQRRSISQSYSLPRSLWWHGALLATSGGVLSLFIFPKYWKIIQVSEESQRNRSQKSDWLNLKQPF